jgi:hypothetical protein
VSRIVSIEGWTKLTEIQTRQQFDRRVSWSVNKQVLLVPAKDAETNLCAKTGWLLIVFVPLVLPKMIGNVNK